MAQLGSNTSGHLFDTSFTTNGVLYSNSSGVINSTSAGSSGQVLTSNGSGSAPTYQTAGGGLTTAFSVAFNSNSGNLSSGAVSTLNFDTVLVDTASGYSAGTYTVPTAGKWLFNFSIVLVSGGVIASSDAFINKNSGTYIFHAPGSIDSASTIANVLNGSLLITLAQSDTIKLDVTATTAGGVTFVATGASNGYLCTFSGLLLFS